MANLLLAVLAGLLAAAVMTTVACMPSRRAVRAHYQGRRDQATNRLDTNRLNNDDNDLNGAPTEYLNSPRDYNTGGDS